MFANQQGWWISEHCLHHIISFATQMGPSHYSHDIWAPQTLYLGIGYSACISREVFVLFCFQLSFQLQPTVRLRCGPLRSLQGIVLFSY